MCVHFTKLAALKVLSFQCYRVVRDEVDSICLYRVLIRFHTVYSVVMTIYLHLKIVILHIYFDENNE